MALLDRFRQIETSELEAITGGADPFVRAREAQLPALTASSQKINLSKASDRSMMTDRPYIEWQKETWGYYDAIGEVKFAFLLLANIGSRVKLYPAVDLDPGAPPTSIFDLRKRRAQLSELEQEKDDAIGLQMPEEVTPEVEETLLSIWRELQNSSGGIPGMLRSYFLNMSVAGECYLAKIDGSWTIRSTEEITLQRGSKIPLLRTLRSSSTMFRNGAGSRQLATNTYIGRIWNAHPRFSGEPDSSMMAVRELCDELLTLQRMIRIVTRSQMQPGVLFVPDGISAAASTPALNQDPEAGQTDLNELEIDPLESELVAAWIAAVSDEASMETLMPLLLRGPGALGEQIKYINLSRDLSKELSARAEDVLNRILQGIDTAKEVVSGLQSVSYRNAEIITEQLYRSHIEPPVLNFVTSLNTMLVRNRLRKAHPNLSEETLGKIGLWYSSDGVVIDSESKQVVNDGFDKFLISGDAWRQRLGFADTEAPSQDEIATRLAIKSPMLPPELAAQIYKHAIQSVLDEATDKNREGALPPEAQEALGLNDPNSNLDVNGIDNTPPSDAPPDSSEATDLGGGEEG